MFFKLEYTYFIGLIITIYQIILFFTSLEIDVDGWDRNTIRNVSYYVTNISENIISDNFCITKSDLIIIVDSTPTNIRERNAIRNGWGKYTGEDVELVFFMGNPKSNEIQQLLLKESKLYKDIIQADFTESYNNLTIKTYLMLDLVKKKCKNTKKFLLKADDDVYINVPKLLNLINERKDNKNLIIGRKYCRLNPIKDPFSKWYCPDYIYNKSKFPDYIAGPAYLMSMDVPEKLIKASNSINFNHLEDVYFTGQCAELAGVNREFSKEFQTNISPNEPCILRDFIMIHNHSPDRILETYNNLNNLSSEICDHFQPIFNVKNWIYSLFIPPSRYKRKPICNISIRF